MLNRFKIRAGENTVKIQAIGSFPFAYSLGVTRFPTFVVTCQKAIISNFRTWKKGVANENRYVR